MKRALFSFGSAAVLTGLLAYMGVLNGNWFAPAHTSGSSAESWAGDGFTVGIVWPPGKGRTFVHGAQLAWEEINNGTGPLREKIRLRVMEEKRPEDGAAVAKRMAADDSVIAVIGHDSFESAIPASLVYEQRKVLFITPKATGPQLTEHGFQYVFRLTPDDRAIASAIAVAAKNLKANKVAVLYARSRHGESVVPQFLAVAGDENIEIPFVRSYVAGRDWKHQDFRPLLAEARQTEFDAILIVDELPRLAKVLTDAQQMGVTQPVLATDKADSVQLWELAGSAADNVYVTSAVDPSSPTPEYRAFKERFTSRYGEEPGYAASQGYEAFSLLVNAVMASRSADPLVLATTLRLNSWKGLFGEFSFTLQGDVVGRKISIKRMKDGRFSTVRF